MRLSPVDAAWLHLERLDNPMVVTGVLVFERRLPFEDLLRVVQERLVDRWPPFARRLVDPEARWPRWEEDPHFELRGHVHHVALPPPGDQRALEDLVGDLASTPLDLRLSPWQGHLVDGVGDGCALVVRIHHCVADGIALARVLLSLADEQPSPQGPAEAHPGHADVDEDIEIPELARALRLGAEATIEAERLLRLPADPSTPLKGPLTPRKACAWSEPFALSRVKEVGRRHGATVNDVLLASLTGAVRGWLAERGEVPEQLRAFVPVDIRGHRPIPRDLGNRFTLVLPALPVGLASPRERLMAIRADMLRLRGSAEPQVVLALLHLVGRSPRLVERVVAELMSRKGSMVVTNVPGPRQRVSLLGVPIQRVLVWVPQAGRLGVGVALFSYAGEVSVGLAADAGLVPKPHDLVGRVLTAFQELEALP